jgi:hypothetical protein
MRFFLLASFLLVSCLNVDYTQRITAPDLFNGTVVKYTQEFFSRCGGQERVQFVALVSRLPSSAKLSAVGHCTTGQGGGAVYILLEAWLAMNDNQRRAIVFHELLHCTQNMQHNPMNWLMAGDGVTPAEVDGLTLEDFYRATGC